MITISAIITTVANTTTSATTTDPTIIIISIITNNLSKAFHNTNYRLKLVIGSSPSRKKKKKIKANIFPNGELLHHYEPR